jgi:hypothetical protein
MYKGQILKGYGVSISNILARKSEKGSLPYCKIRAESEGNDQPGPLVSLIIQCNL